MKWINLSALVKVFNLINKIKPAALPYPFGSSTVPSFGTEAS